MSSPEETSRLLSEPDRKTLLVLARRSIDNGLNLGSPLQIEASEYPAALRALRSSFVTLNRGGSLRGCIGHLEAIQPLVADVAENAYSAAFRDPRFPPLSSDELGDLDVHISVLTPARPMIFGSQEQLIAALRPGIDGVILQEGRHRGTFLPSVWDSLTEPAEFLKHLKAKAGLAYDYWSDSIEILRYETESFHD